MTNPAPAFWSPRIGALEPYVPGEQPRIANLVKLNTNENPYPPSPGVVEAIQRAAASGLELYPDPTSLALREAVARRHGLSVDQVFAGNGSDEVLAHAFFAFFQQAEPLLMPDVSYSFYKVYAQIYGIACELQPVDEGLRIDKLLQACPDRVLLVDEAYVDFGGESALPLVGKYPNLLVVQTLSKSRSLAGLRVGFACGQPHLIDGLVRVKDSFNSYPIDRLASAGAAASFEDEAAFRAACDTVIDTREGLTLQLEDLGFEVLPSQANFVFARHPKRDAAELAALLRERAVLVRHFRQPRIAQYLRISIGTREQCSLLVQHLQDILHTSAP